MRIQTYRALKEHLYTSLISLSLSSMLEHTSLRNHLFNTASAQMRFDFNSERTLQ